MAAVQILLWQVPGRSSGTGRRSFSVMPSVAFAGALAAGFVVATPFAVLDAASFIGDVRYDLTHLSGGHAVPLGRGWWVHAVRSLPYSCARWCSRRRSSGSGSPSVATRGTRSSPAPSRSRSTA